MSIVRSDVELEGVKSYFFAPLLKYILENEEALVQNSEVNKSAAFVLGLTDEPPNESELFSILIGESPDNVKLVTAIDNLFLFGGDSVGFIKQLGETLAQRGQQHDILQLRVASMNIAAFENELSKHVRKSIIGKVQGGHLLKFIQSIISSKENDKLDAYSNLCVSDYDWDAFVFLKLFAHNVSERKEEIEAIRNNIIEKLGANHSSLVDLWLNGPKVDPKVELARNLKKPILEATNAVLPSIVDSILSLITREDDVALTELAPVTGQLFHLIVRAILSGERQLVKNIHSEIPESIRKVMFPGLVRTVFKNSFTLVSYFCQIFAPVVNSNRLTFNDVANSEVYYDLNEPWKRDALLKLIIDYKAAIERDVFGFPVDLVSNHQVSNVLTAFDFTIEVVKNFENQPCFAWLNSVQKSSIITILKAEHVSTENAKIHLSRLIAALETENVVPPSRTSIANEPEVADPTPDNYNYTKEEIKKIHVHDEISFPSKHILSGIQQPQLVVNSELVDIGYGVRVGAKNIETPLDLGKDEVDLVASNFEESEKIKVNSTLEQPVITALQTDDFEEKKESSLEKHPELPTSVITEVSHEFSQVEVTKSTVETTPESTFIEKTNTIVTPTSNVENIVPTNPVVPIITEQQQQNIVYGSGDSANISRPTSKFQTGGFVKANTSSKFGRVGYAQQTPTGFGTHADRNEGGQQGGGGHGHGGQRFAGGGPRQGGYGGNRGGGGNFRGGRS